MADMAKVTIRMPKPLKKTIQKDAIDKDSTMNNQILKTLVEAYAS